MAKKETMSSAAKTLAELEVRGDRLTEWSNEHRTKILVSIVVVLAVAAIGGFYLQHRAGVSTEAANALALATSEYRQAMGADPMGGEIPEPANPAVALEARKKFAERFAAVATEHAGTTSGALAWLEAGQRSLELGERDEARARFEKARDGASDSAIAALAWVRLAELAEDAKDFAGAAAAYEAAAAIPSYPLRAAALAEAARCFVGAGEKDKGLATFQRLESEFPDETIAPPIQAMFQELRASS